MATVLLTPGGSSFCSRRSDVRNEPRGIVDKRCFLFKVPCRAVCYEQDELDCHIEEHGEGYGEIFIEFEIRRANGKGHEEHGREK